MESLVPLDATSSSPGDFNAGNVSECLNNFNGRSGGSDFFLLLLIYKLRRVKKSNERCLSQKICVYLNVSRNLRITTKSVTPTIVHLRRLEGNASAYSRRSE